MMPEIPGARLPGNVWLRCRASMNLGGCALAGKTEDRMATPEGSWRYVSREYGS